jgi:6-pyruvoyltetrahydropterin/6-carboxytetrahydropterin synthase
MAEYLLSAEATFSAAHTLPGVEVCDRLHGHDWRMRLTVRIDESHMGDDAMGIDFRVIEDIAKQAVADFDHRYLNDLKPFENHPPTAERLAQVICMAASRQLAADAPRASVEQVELWEVPQFRVVYKP